MRNYLRAEFYKSLNRPFLINFTWILSFIAVVSNLLIYRVAPLTMPSFSIAFEVGRPLLSITIFVVITFIDPIFYDEFRNNTMKNTVALGIDRKKIILSKTIVEIVLAIISLIIILLFYFGSAAIFGNTSSIDMIMVNKFFYTIAGIVPLAIGGVALGNFTGLIGNSDIMKGLNYVFIIVLFPKIINLLGNLLDINTLAVIGNKISIYNTSQSLSSLNVLNPESYIMEAIIKGIIYFIIFTFINIKLFDKKDL